MPEQRPPIEIRPLEARDLGPLVSLMEELAESARTAAGFSPSRFEEIFREMRRRPDGYLNLVASTRGRVVGFISVVFYRSFFHIVGTALINELVVTRSRRGEGIGAALIAAVREEAKHRSMDEIEVGTETANRTAQGFYRKQGFTEEYLLLGMELPPLGTPPAGA